MTRNLVTVAFLAFAVASGTGCSAAPPADSQEKFGVRMARMNLWREALFRFTRAVEMAPEDALAHSNLAVAYEANGDFENAAKHYREAMRLDRANPFIQKNYSRYVEFTSRNKKRQQPAKKDGPAASPAAATGAGSSAPSAAAPPEPPLLPVDTPVGTTGARPPGPAATQPPPVPPPPPQPQPQNPPGDHP